MRGLSSRPLEAMAPSALRSSDSAGLDWGVRVVPVEPMPEEATPTEEEDEEPDEIEPGFAVAFAGRCCCSPGAEAVEEAELAAFCLRLRGWYLYSGCSRLWRTLRRSASRWNGIFSSSFRILPKKKKKS